MEAVDELTYAEAISWLAQRAGEAMQISVGTSASGNTGVSASGVLARGDDEVTVIDARPGRIDAFRVGDVAVQMLEGDFVAGDLIDWGNDAKKVTLKMEFREIHLLFTASH